MRIEITTSTDELTLDEIKTKLEKQIDWNTKAIDLQVGSNSTHRNIDPTIIVAVLGIIGTSLAPLISGLLDIIKSKKELYIEIHAKDGRILKIPADIDEEKLDRLIQTIQKLDTEKIEIARR